MRSKQNTKKVSEKLFTELFTKKKHPGIREKPECRDAPGNKRENQVTLMWCGINSVRSAIASCGYDPTYMLGRALRLRSLVDF